MIANFSGISQKKCLVKIREYKIISDNLLSELYICERIIMNLQVIPQNMHVWLNEPKRDNGIIENVSQIQNFITTVNL